MVLGKKKVCDRESTNVLDNHLGNVLAVVSDRKIAVEDQGNPGTVEYYEADIVNAQDYYPFGMIMPGRSVSAGEYRYGFGGQEMDNEVSGTGNSYTAEFWQYDPRLGRRWNIDPVKVAYESGYATFRNNPIAYIDPEGDVPYSETVEDGGDVTSEFGMREHPITEEVSGHEGIDIDGNQGDDINAFAEGEVSRTGYSETWGNYVVVEHEDDYFSLYAHIENDGTDVDVGETVEDGQTLGSVGETGAATGPHLHLEVGQADNVDQFLSRDNRNETRTDPQEIGNLQEHIHGSDQLYESGTIYEVEVTLPEIPSRPSTDPIHVEPAYQNNPEVELEAR